MRPGSRQSKRRQAEKHWPATHRHHDRRADDECGHDQTHRHAARSAVELVAHPVEVAQFNVHLHAAVTHVAQQARQIVRHGTQQVGHADGARRASSATLSQWTSRPAFSSRSAQPMRRTTSPQPVPHQDTNDLLQAAEVQRRLNRAIQHCDGALLFMRASLGTRRTVHLSWIN